MILEKGQVWVDKQGGYRKITFLEGKKLCYEYKHPQSDLVKSMNSSVAAFIEKINTHGYVIKEKEPESAAWADWPEEAEVLSWEEWE